MVIAEFVEANLTSVDPFIIKSPVKSRLFLKLTIPLALIIKSPSTLTAFSKVTLIASLIVRAPRGVVLPISRLNVALPLLFKFNVRVSFEPFTAFSLWVLALPPSMILPEVLSESVAVVMIRGPFIAIESCKGVSKL